MELWGGHAHALITERQRRCLDRLKSLTYKDLHRPSKVFQKLVELLLVTSVVREGWTMYAWKDVVWKPAPVT